MDAFKTACQNGLDSQQRCSFGGPVTGASCAVLQTGQNDESFVLGRVFPGGIVNAHLLSTRLIPGHTAFHTGNHQVLDADIGKGAACHDTVIAAP